MDTAKLTCKLACLTIILFGLSCVTVQAQELHFQTGIAVTPANFPQHTPTDIDDAFQLAHKVARHAVFIFQWHELNPDIVKLMLSKSRKAGLIPILGLSPTSLDQGRKELDLPEQVRQAAGGSISFSNPIIRQAFIRDAKQLAHLHPEYLCLATEINFLALQRLDEYLQFVTLYKQAYAAVKTISPQTKVFVSFQWEWVRILDAREIHKVREHSKVINIFKPQLDLVGLTTYPSAFHENPAALLPDYYSWVYRHIDKRDEVMLMETGWPSKGSGSEQEQKEFIDRLPALLREVNISVVAWSLLHDVKLAEFDANLNSTGLLTSSGRKKPAFAAFKRLRR